MKKKEAEKGPVLEDGFYCIVDGRRYGPFLERYRRQFRTLVRRAGVSFETVRLSQGWVNPKPTEKIQKDKSTPLLDGVGFEPMPKIANWWNT